MIDRISTAEVVYSGRGQTSSCVAIPILIPAVELDDFAIQIEASRMHDIRRPILHWPTDMQAAPIPLSRVA